MKRYTYLIKSSKASAIVTLENEFKLGFDEIEFIEGGYRHVYSRIMSQEKTDKLTILYATEYKKIHIARDAVFVGE